MQRALLCISMLIWFEFFFISFRSTQRIWLNRSFHIKIATEGYSADAEWRCIANEQYHHRFRPDSKRYGQLKSHTANIPLPSDKITPPHDKKKLRNTDAINVRFVYLISERYKVWGGEQRRQAAESTWACARLRLSIDLCNGVCGV